MSNPTGMREVDAWGGVGWVGGWGKGGAGRQCGAGRWLDSVLVVGWGGEGGFRSCVGPDFTWARAARAWGVVEVLLRVRRTWVVSMLSSMPCRVWVGGGWVCMKSAVGRGGLCLIRMGGLQQQGPPKRKKRARAEGRCLADAAAFPGWGTSTKAGRVPVPRPCVLLPWVCWVWAEAGREGRGVNAVEFTPTITRKERKKESAPFFF